MFIKRLALKKILSFNDAEVELGQFERLDRAECGGKDQSY